MEGKTSPPVPRKKKRIRKIFLWTFGIIVSLFVLVFLLLSVLFPASYVKKILVKNLKTQLKREVIFKELDFNIFTGIKILELEIRERPLFGGSSPFVRVKSLRVDYSVLPLIFGKLVLNEATIKGAEVYVISRRMGGEVRYNFDDIFQIPASSKTQEPVKEPEEKKEPSAPPHMQKPAFPVEFSLGEVGIEDAKIDFKDYSNPVLPARYTVDKVTAIVTNLTSGTSPFGIRGGVRVSFGELKETGEAKKNFNLYTRLEGTIQPFSKQGNLNPEVHLKFMVKDFLVDSSFLQTVINNGIKLFLRQFIDRINELPQLTEEIKKKLQPKIDELLNKAHARIDALKKDQELEEEVLKKEKEAVLQDFDKKIDPVLNQILQRVMNQASKLPQPVQEQIRKEAENQKQQIKTKARQTLSIELDKIITSAQREYEQQMNLLKNAARSQIDKAITIAIWKAAQELKKYAESLEKEGLGLGFLSGELTFKEGSIEITVKDWKLFLDRIDLMGKAVGIKGQVSYGIFSEAGETNLNLYFTPGADPLGIFTPYKKNEWIELPLVLSFNNCTGEYKLNKSLITAEQVKDFVLKYAVGYVERQLGAASEDTTTSQNLEKYKKMIEDLKKGNIQNALSSMEQTKRLVEKYQKAQKTTQKAKDAVNKAQNTIKKIKKIKKPW